MTSDRPSGPARETGSPEEAQVVPPRHASVSKGLMAGALVALGCAAVLLVCAALLPAVVGVEESAPEPVAWARLLALPVAVLAIVLLVLHGSRAGWWARLLAAGSTVVFLAVSGWLVWRGLPVPGPEFGLGRRLGWVLVGCGLGVVASLVYAAGAYLAHRAGSTGPGRRPTAVTAGVVALVLALGTVGGVLGADRWTAAQNTDIALADGLLTGQQPSTLDGGKSWQTRSSEDVAATQGGLVVVAGPGVYAVDPTTGRQRWHYFHWGTSFEGTPVVSSDGRYIAVAAGLTSGLERVLGGVSESVVYVFDAVRGRLLGSFDAHGGQPRYVDDELVVVDGAEETQRGDFTAYRHDGDVAWTHSGDCVFGAVARLGDAVLVGRNCDGRAHVSVRDVTTGETRWRWEHNGYISPNGIVVERSGPAAGTVVLDLPGDGDVQDRDLHSVTALDVETGDARWSRAEVRVGRAGEEGQHSYSLGYVAGTLVLAGGRRYSDGPPLELIGLDPATGRERWRTQPALDYIATYQREVLPTPGSTGIAGAVGYVSGRVLAAGKAYQARDHGGDAVAVRVFDARTGERVRSTLLRSDLTQSHSLHVVGDTVALVAAPEDSDDRYLVGLS